MTKTEKLCLVNIEEIHFPDRQTKEEIIKYKHTFIDSDNNTIIGYTDENVFQDLVTEEAKYSPREAKLFVWKGRTWENQIRWTLSTENLN